ncbi:uncharacterized protein LOC117786638 [Drosophila innubila]|uniref:uncharacterized protein LOC117786638 n=1 Tax=Drosophila innubila TaxID=198719 RepID=UPI00148D4080|nr:uncharacterized protein LOC117786638 [Drosophila innubila]
MQLLILLALCWMTASLEASSSDAQKAVDQSFLPRYTLLAESKKKEQDLDRQPNDVAASEQQPWRRFAYAGYGGQQSSWPGSSSAASLAAMLGPGLLLLGVNLGALLYMLLGVLGLAPPQHIGGGGHGGHDIYRSDRQHLGGGKELDMYL